jgi:hypothetical protein
LHGVDFASIGGSNGATVVQVFGASICVNVDANKILEAVAAVFELDFLGNKTARSQEARGNRGVCGCLLQVSFLMYI